MNPTFPDDHRIPSRSPLFYSVLLVCLVLLPSCGQPAHSTSRTAPSPPTRTATPAPTRVSAPTTTVALAPLLQEIHMMTSSAGWAITADAQHVVHTTGDPTRWQDVTPPSTRSQASLGGTAFWDALTAWVAVDLVVYRTQDGGHTWQSAPLPDHGLGASAIFFLNRHLGWLLVDKGIAAGSQSVDVLGTSDGGTTWKILSVCGPTVKNPGALPFEGGKSGLSFVNATTGWVAGSTAQDGFAWLYVTHDGGATWQQQPFPLPADAIQVLTFPPVFFNARDGLLSALVSRPPGQTVEMIARTRDGGATWHFTGSAPTAATIGTSDFVDLMHGWTARNTFDPRGQYLESTLYSSRDGGAHWTPHRVTLQADLFQIDFISPTQGWALDSLHLLYHTTDGGQTWRKEESGWSDPLS